MIIHLLVVDDTDFEHSDKYTLPRQCVHWPEKVTGQKGWRT
jgi:hypothetical protein